MERYANNAGTTLLGAIDSFQTAFDVANGTPFPSTGSFRITVGGEIMIVTAVSGNNFTVTRGAEGTSTVSHNAGDPVNHTLTAGSLVALIGSGPIANLPPTNQANNGAIFLAQDLPLLFRGNGSTFQSFGPLLRMTSPPAGNWTVNNANTSNGTTTVTTFLDGSFVLQDVSTTNSTVLRTYTQPTPNRPYNVTVFAIPSLALAPTAGFNSIVGVTLRSSTTDQAYLFGWTMVGTSWGTGFTSSNCTSSNTTGPIPPSNISSNNHAQPLFGMYIRVSETPTSRRFLVSHDGITFNEVFRQLTANTTFSADQVGIGVLVNTPLNTPSLVAGITVLSWDVGP